MLIALVSVATTVELDDGALDAMIARAKSDAEAAERAVTPVDELQTVATLEDEPSRDAEDALSTPERHRTVTD